MAGLHHVNGEWVVDHEGQEVEVSGDFWTLRILADRMGLGIKDIYYHRKMGRFPYYRIKETGQYLVLPAVGEAVASHYLKHHMWLTFRVEGDRIVMYDERYGTRAHGRRVLVETGQLHVPPAGAALPITAKLDVPD